MKIREYMESESGRVTVALGLLVAGWIASSLHLPKAEDVIVFSLGLLGGMLNPAHQPTLPAGMTGTTTITQTAETPEPKP